MIKLQTVKLSFVVDSKYTNKQAEHFWNGVNQLNNVLHRHLLENPIHPNLNTFEIIFTKDVDVKEIVDYINKLESEMNEIK